MESSSPIDRGEFSGAGFSMDVTPYIHTYIVYFPRSQGCPYGLVRWVFVGFSLLMFVFFFFFFGGGGGGGGGIVIFILFYCSFFLWWLVTLPHVSRFIVTRIFSAALLRVSVFSLKISSLVVLGVSLFSHCCSTWSWVSSSWWHILHALSGYLFL